MHLLETIRVALSSLSTNRLRSVLATLGITIGIAAVSTLLSVGGALQRFTTEQLASFNTNAITILAQPDFASGGTAPAQGQLTDGDVAALRALPNVAQVVAIYQQNTDVRGGGQLLSAELLGADQAYLYEREGPFLGRFLTVEDVTQRAKVAVLSRSLAAQLFPDGRPLGRELVLRGHTFTVVGVLPDQGGLFAGSQRLLVPISTARDRLFPESAASRAQVSEVTIHLQDSGRIAETEAAATQLLRERHKLRPEQGNDFTRQDIREFAETNNNILAGLTAFLGVVGGISLLVGGIGITNIMLVSVTERTREIGLRKAVGARRGDILRQFLTEAVALSLLGGLGGLGLSTLLVEGGAIGIHMLLPSVGIAPFLGLDLNAALLALGFASLVGIGAGLYPAMRASRLAPIEALRSA